MKKETARSRKQDPVWDLKQIRKYSWDTVFKKGWKAWLALVAVCFLFSFIGASSPMQTEVLDYMDPLLGFNKDADYETDVEYLKEYVLSRKAVSGLSAETKESIGGTIENVSTSNSWVIRALASNAAYFERNPGEVIVNLVLVAVIMLVIRFFFQNVVNVGMYRYVMENRQQKRVRFRRLLAPFHLRSIPHMVWVMLRYYGALIRWYMLLVIPGIYKTFQYAMVPYILAENPTVSWKEARNLSKQMTKGYKWKMFVARLSYIYIWILELVPFAGMLVAVPLEEQLKAEIYFTLRNRPGISYDALPEKAFADAPYVKKEKQFKHKVLHSIEAPSYVLQDINTKTAHKKGKFRFDYSPFDIVFMFFTFCLIGWVWEVSYEFVNSRVLVNRGTMYGPWIPIYGFGGLAIVLLLGRFKENKFKLFGMTMLVCAIQEYLASFALEFIFNSSYWDYKHMLMNVNGRICLAGLLAFGIGGLFGVYVAAPAISRFVDRFARKTQIVAAIVLCTLFATDLVCCAIFGFNKGSGVGGEIENTPAVTQDVNAGDEKTEPSISEPVITAQER
ncbi:MAG: DUF975 family protein [Clostridiales bacterium]|nr:DUF975 family protein [Clostridiales bacterium]